MLDSLALERQRDWQRSEISLMLESAADRLAWSESVQRVDVAHCHWLCTIAKWSHLGPLAMSELELGSLVVQRCLCCLLGMCVFLVV